MPDPIPVRVALRIRPLVPRETGDGCKECIKCIPGHPQVVIGEDKAFTYDYVFETYSKQEDLYNKTVIPLVEGFFKGYNATVLAYGQTGSGKTYSMGTAFTMCSEKDETKGVIPRLINTIFKLIEERKDKTEFLLKVSFLEVLQCISKNIKQLNLNSANQIAYELASQHTVANWWQAFT